MDDQNFSVAPGRDLSRQDATDNDTDFSLSLEEVAERYERARHSRSLRTLQRYCADGHLDARKIETMTGDKYLVTPQSVARHIAQIVEFYKLAAVATRRDRSQQVATSTTLEESLPATAPENGLHAEPDRARHASTEVVAEISVHPQEPRHEATTAHDTSRPAAADQPLIGESSRYVAQLEHQLEIARDERDFLREQINRKDRTIEALIERDRETNFLVRGLQEMLTPLLPNRRQEPPAHTQ